MPINSPVTSFEASIVKWIFMPLMLVFIVFLLGSRMFGVIRCDRICENNGYLQSTHIPSDRFGFDEKCLCEEPTDPKTMKPKIELPYPK